MARYFITVSFYCLARYIVLVSFFVLARCTGMVSLPGSTRCTGVVFSSVPARFLFWCSRRFSTLILFGFLDWCGALHRFGFLLVGGSLTSMVFLSCFVTLANPGLLLLLVRSQAQVF